MRHHKAGSSLDHVQVRHLVALHRRLLNSTFDHFIHINGQVNVFPLNHLSTTVEFVSQ